MCSVLPTKAEFLTDNYYNYYNWDCQKSHILRTSQTWLLVETRHSFQSSCIILYVNCIVISVCDSGKHLYKSITINSGNMERTRLSIFRKQRRWDEKQHPRELLSGYLPSLMFLVWEYFFSKQNENSHLTFSIIFSMYNYKKNLSMKLKDLVKVILNLWHSYRVF